MKFKDRLDAAYGKVARKGDDATAKKGASAAPPAKARKPSPETPREGDRANPPSATPAGKPARGTPGAATGANATSPKPAAAKHGAGSAKAQAARGAVEGELLKTGDSGYAKAARFLILLGKDDAAKVISRLKPEEIEGISAEIAKVRSIGTVEANEILTEFGWLVKTQGYSFEGGPETAERMLNAAFGPERAKEYMRKASPDTSKPFRFLVEHSTAQIRLVLEGESPQVLAIVLPFLQPKKASELISEMREPLRGEVVRRLAKLDRISPEVVRSVEEGVKQKLLSIATISDETIDGRSALADILRNVDPSLSESILATLDETAPAVSEAVREKLFTIEDMLRIPSRELQGILMRFDEKTIALALKGREPEFRDGLLASVSQTRRAIVMEEFEIMGSVRRDDAKEALGSILAACKIAYERGDFALEGDDDLVV